MGFAPMDDDAATSANGVPFRWKVERQHQQGGGGAGGRQLGKRTPVSSSSSSSSPSTTTGYGGGGGGGGDDARYVLVEHSRGDATQISDLRPVLSSNSTFSSVIVLGTAASVDLPARSCDLRVLSV